MSSRRGFISRASAAAGIFASARTLSGGELTSARESAEKTGKTGANSAHASGPPVLTQTPDVPVLAHEMDGGIKVFKLAAEPVRRKIAPWKTIDCWGFNGVSPGPSIQAYEGDRIRIVLENRLPESLAIHWHGLEIPYAMDGMPYISKNQSHPAVSSRMNSRSIRTAFFLSFTFTDAANNGAGGSCLFCTRHGRRLRWSITILQLCCRSGPCCRTTRCRIRRTWNGTG
jgi:Multicopper oxidase